MRTALLLLAALLPVPLAVGADDGGAAFRAACTAAAAQGDGLTVAGSDGWLFARPELRFCGLARFWGPDAAAVSRASTPALADPLPAIVDFHAQLAKAGITLLVVPVPAKAVIHAQQVPGMPAGVGGADAAQRACYAALRAAGVDVLDLTDDFRVAAAAGEEPFCRTDTHWSPIGCRRAAEAIRMRLGGGLVAPGVAWISVAGQRPIHGDLAPAGDEPSEVLPCATLTPPGGQAEDRASQIVLLGDSHCLVFHVGQELHGTGAGLADHLGAQLGYPVDVIGVRGADATTPRQNLQRRAKTAGYLAGKKAVVWCFAARAFSESQSGWAKVIIQKQP